MGNSPLGGPILSAMLGQSPGLPGKHPAFPDLPRLLGNAGRSRELHEFLEAKRKGSVVSRQGNRNSWWSALSSLGWPLIIGLAMSSVFFVLILRGPLQGPLTYRYFAGHPVNISETVLFFIGLAALLLKSGEVLVQSSTLRRIRLESEEAPLEVEACSGLLDSLAKMPAHLQDSYLGKRLHAALDYVWRCQSAAGLGDELKYLADADAVRQHESYSLVRIIIWATPMLGFLGTVVGITQALGDLDPQLLATDPKTAMQGLLGGLYVAFDTTAEALSLSMVLMFVQFFTDRLESQLLSAVDQQAQEELLGRFASAATEANPQLAAVQRMSTTVLNAAHQLVQDQTEQWKLTLNEVNSQWKELLDSSGQNLRTALTSSLETSLRSFTDRMTSAERETEERLHSRWEQWQAALSDNARLMHTQQTELVRQGEVMTQVLKATGDIVQLEEALNGNLRAIAGTRQFEEILINLSAAIHLLNSRFGEVAFANPAVELPKPVKQGRAA